MIEDNLFTLQYCFEGCYKLIRQLIVTCLDYSKAFDSIRQGKIIEALIHYKINYKIIDAIANIYRNDYTASTIWRNKKRNRNCKWNKTRLYWINYYF